MHLSEIPQRLGQTRTIVLLGTSLLLMLIFGVVLANVNREQLVAKNEQLQKSVANLQTENDQLHTLTNQLNVKLEMAQMRAEQLKQDVVRLEESVFNLQKDKAFYQYVVAPETTQDGFFIDGLEIFPTTTDGYYKATMVLLQQREVSAIVRGKLSVAVTGSLAGKHKILTTEKDAILPEGEIEYGFRYFQPVTLYLQLPAAFTPETIEFSTTVYQYKRRRGDYQRSYNWHELIADM